jgi:hypothetical protein
MKDGKLIIMGSLTNNFARNKELKLVLIYCDW